MPRRGFWLDFLWVEDELVMLYNRSEKLHDVIVRLEELWEERGVELEQMEEEAFEKVLEEALGEEGYTLLDEIYWQVRDCLFKCRNNTTDRVEPEVWITRNNRVNCKCRPPTPTSWEAE